MAARGKRRELAFYFPVRIFYILLISKCRGESNGNLCIGTCKKNAAAQCRLPTNLGAEYFQKMESWHCAAVFSLQVPKSCTDLHSTLLYIWMRGNYSKFVRKHEILALGVCSLQPCPNAVHGFAAPRSCLTYLLTIFFVSTMTNMMKCLVNWIPPHTYVRFEQDPTLL